jgi:hypothetical protein
MVRAQGSLLASLALVKGGTASMRGRGYWNDTSVLHLYFGASAEESRRSPSRSGRAAQQTQQTQQTLADRDGRLTDIVLGSPMPHHRTLVDGFLWTGTLQAALMAYIGLDRVQHSGEHMSGKNFRHHYDRAATARGKGVDASDDSALLEKA